MQIEKEGILARARASGSNEPNWHQRGGRGAGRGAGGPGGATPRFWMPTTPPTNCWRGPLGGGGAWEGGFKDLI